MSIITSRSSWHQDLSSILRNEEELLQLSIGFSASKCKKQSNLGLKQGKLNVFQILSKKCVNDLKFFSNLVFKDGSQFKFNNQATRGTLVASYLLNNCRSKQKNKRKNLGKNQSWKVETFGIKSWVILALIIKLWLIKSGVHPNPGPKVLDYAKIVTLLTYNCRGLRDGAKLRRLLSKLSNLVDKNYIIALQETHNINDKLFNLLWKHNHIRNCTLSNKRGVMLLFNNEFQVNRVLADKDERFIIADIGNSKIKLIIGNVYYPNVINEAITFSENFYKHFLEFQFENPEAMCAVMGDMNVCFNNSDFLNRLDRTGENRLVRTISLNNEACDLKDSYRAKYPQGGYTWNRGNCFSRLDYVFVSNLMIKNLVVAEIDWELDKSDHAALKCGFRILEETEKGRGIVGINASLLNNNNSLSIITTNIVDMLAQIPVTWDPHTKLEFMKVAVRSAFAEAAKDINKVRKSEVDILEEQINRLVNYKILESQKRDSDNNKMDRVEVAISELKAELDSERNRQDRERNFHSEAKWYEEGEKSNKYFLGLLKSRMKQKLISTIKDEGVVHKTKDTIMKCIQEFYQNLYNEVRFVGNRDNQFFNKCPKLSEDSSRDLDREITVEELRLTLNNMKDSAPGPDGIPYSVYKRLWPILGQFIIDAWNFSLTTGSLPPSYSESALTLLPKVGKNLEEIKNWRPITLTNCDQKIITKALANRMAKHLESVIHSSQTAYVPGRSVIDNLRANLYMKNYCERNKIDGLMVSLDAKKAFDSVSHEYIRKVLKAYGVGDNFIKYFNVLYKDISVKILVNGFFSEKVMIKRGVKQGDALSCALFILCIDPLIRNINANNNVEQISFKSKLTNTIGGIKCSGYADDITIICMNTNRSIKAIFSEYERLTVLSGLELNADKTEVIRIGNRIEEISLTFNYLNKSYTVKTVGCIKVCGVYYCNDASEEYDLNILEKIERLEIQLKKWMCRGLTTEGKILIIKTYGLSQLIYNLQTYQIRNEDLIIIERMIFKFIWSKNWNTHRVSERIKRSVLKNEYSNGGLNAPDIECLNRALKLKQFIRASTSTHAIKNLQIVSLEKLGYEEVLGQEYHRFCKEDEIIKSAQESINFLTDLSRSEAYGIGDNGQSSKLAIEIVGSIYITHFLARKSKPMEECISNLLKSEGVEHLSDLIEEIEIANERKRKSTLKFIEVTFPNNLLEIARNFDKSLNEELLTLKHFYLGSDTFVPSNEITVKLLQIRLKQALGKVTKVDYDAKLGINHFDISDVMTIRKQIKNVKLRNVFYRLINRDFYDRIKMKKYKMVENDECERCNSPESTEHLLWGCRWSKLAWENYNSYLISLGISGGLVDSYRDVYSFNNGSGINTVKLKIINELIQIIRPKNLTIDRIKNITNNIKNIEKYIAVKNNNLIRHEKKWYMFN